MALRKNGDGTVTVVPKVGTTGGPTDSSTVTRRRPALARSVPAAAKRLPSVMKPARKGK